MSGTGAGSPARCYLPSIGDETPQFFGILIVYFCYFARTKGTNPSPGCISWFTPPRTLCCTISCLCHYWSTPCLQTI